MILVDTEPWATGKFRRVTREEAQSEELGVVDGNGLVASVLRTAGVLGDDEEGVGGNE
jgi:hypothetical protein